MTDSSSDRRRQVEALISEALKMPPDQQTQFLDTRCAGNSELRKEVNAVLESGESPIKLARPPGSGTPRATSGNLLSHYKIISMLGAGGMGEVYLAEDMQLRRRVALKMIVPGLSRDERGLRRFEQEAQAASALNHPNILTVYEFGQADGVHYIASEFVEGVTLRKKMAFTKLDLSAAIDIAMQIASALAAAHESGIVHRDIKPDNVIVRSDGIVKVLDFGIAKLSGTFVDDTIHHSAATVTSSISETGMVVGTAKYMSPEQARGLDVDARSDIFSLGSVLYELVTGRQAFPGATSSDVIAEILKSEPAPPIEFAPDLPYDVERIISKALRKERENRYQSIRDLLIDLQDFKKESEFNAKLQGAVRPEGAKTGSGWRTPSSQTSGISLRQQRRFPRGKLFWGVAAMAVAAIIGLVGYLHERKPAEPPAATRIRNLAVLPFRNLKQDPAFDFLGFSLADEIITKLEYVNSLVIRPSSSVDKYRDQSIDPQKAAAELNVDTLLMGSFIKDGDDLRITTQLIDVKGDKILWRDVIDVKYDKLLTVQDRVAQQILKELEVRLSPAEAANLKPEKPISALAYEYYLRGVDLYSLSQFAAAIGMLEKSTQIDPNYAPAWAHLGRAYTTNASLQFGGREDYSKAQAAYEKAIALSPALVEPRIYMANLFTDTGRVEQAVPLVRSVLRDNPNNAEAHWELGYAYRFGGMLQESLEECKKAREINPQVKINSSAMNSYLYLGEYKEFLQSLPVNDSVYILFYRGFAEYYLKNPNQATSYFDRAYQRDSSSLQAMIGEAFSRSIQHDNAHGLELLKQTEAKIAERGVTDAEGMYKVAQAYAALGDKTSCLRMLRASVAGGFFPYPYFVNDPLLQDVHGEAEFQSLMDQARNRHEQFKSMFF